MSKHMFRAFLGPNPDKMTLTQARDAFQTWLNNHNEWEGDVVAHQLNETSPLGSTIVYWSGVGRFFSTDVKDNLFQKLEDKYLNKVDWYRIGYHVCDHDAVSSERIGCSWDEEREWTASGQSIPPEVPDINVAAADGGVSRRQAIKAAGTVVGASAVGGAGLATVPERAAAATLTWETAADWDGAASESGVVHESVANTDHNDDTIVKQGYAIASPFLSADLVSYWPLDEDSGSTATDVAGTNDGATTGATVGVTGILGTTAYSFDGTDDFVDLGNPHDLTGGYTISAWANFDDVTSNHVVYAAGAGAYQTLFRSESGNIVYFHNHSGGGGKITGSAISTGTWYHIAVTWDGSTFQTYLNATPDGSGAFSDLQNASTQHKLGERVSTSGEHMSGDIDDARVYGRALTGAEIQTLYDVVATQGQLITAEKTS